MLPPDDVAAAVADLKGTIDGDIQIMGSSQLVRYLVGHDLIDQFSLMIHPIILGGGKRLFPDDGISRNFKLQDLQQASPGVLIATYVKA